MTPNGRRNLQNTPENRDGEKQRHRCPLPRLRLPEILVPRRGEIRPRVRKIHFITSGQKPDWLDAENPKINLVSHKDYIPQQFLPTYNSVVIERYIHKIPGLADHFVYFNDDFYIINSITPERFFRNGLPCDIAAFQYNPSWSQWYRRIKNNIRIINANFSKPEVMARFHDKWFDKSYGSRARWNYLLRYYDKFITLRTPTTPSPTSKALSREVWQAAGKELTATSVNRFRASDDYTPELFPHMADMQRQLRALQHLQRHQNVSADDQIEESHKAIREQSYSLICLNDNIHIRNYNQIMAEVRDAFESILPEKSSFEL